MPEVAQKDLGAFIYKDWGKEKENVDVHSKNRQTKKTKTKNKKYIYIYEHKMFILVTCLNYGHSPSPQTYQLLIDLLIRLHVIFANSYIKQIKPPNVDTVSLIR